ncbi:Protein of uncharacterised function (DUF2442) [Plesiomonas shigelloides]|uniref:DUF2442 domain-containing protein n=1 Tax=Plesiomonas shigelloides TaxID=703 RepID=UPI000E01098D|nr:DUF2442 domain-containing protein [Plesiomonas shigelloides]SUB62912.1 Protein of uncharacterised function (DUF2442) [Plesiomonas shigelloides]
MLKIIDVDYIDGYRLAVQFSDGLNGEADLTPFFSKPPFSDVDGFLNFGLTESGSLSWGDDLELSAYTVRSVTEGSIQAVSLPDATDVEAVMKLAARDSVTEGRPDILRAAIYGFTE